MSWGRLWWGRCLAAAAAIARAIAIALERGAARRLALADPLAGLRERFPGAPDHWLQMIAERAPDLGGGDPAEALRGPPPPPFRPAAGERRREAQAIRREENRQAGEPPRFPTAEAKKKQRASFIERVRAVSARALWPTARGRERGHIDTAFVEPSPQLTPAKLSLARQKGGRSASSADFEPAEAEVLRGGAAHQYSSQRPHRQTEVEWQGREVPSDTRPEWPSLPSFSREPIEFGSSAEPSSRRAPSFAEAHVRAAPAEPHWRHHGAPVQAPAPAALLPNRWPALPPQLSEVEEAHFLPPRLGELAAEQESGRWNG